MNTTTRQARHRRGGFTMVEVMVAVGVLLVAVLTAFGSQISSYRMMDGSRASNVAMGDLAACMEELLLVPLDQLPVEGSEFADGVSVAGYEDLHLRGQRVVATYPGFVAGQPVPDPLPIVLTASWTDDRGLQRLVTLRSMKVR